VKFTNQEEVMFKKVVVIALLVLSVVMAINVAGCAGSGTKADVTSGAE